MFRRSNKPKHVKNSEPLREMTQHYEFIAAVQTDPGLIRELNEDCGRFVKPIESDVLAKKGSFCIVADGMGGHSGGEVASKIAVDTVSRVYYELEKSPQESLRTALEEANRQIHAASLAEESLKGMGTTCTALVLYGSSAIVAHVGDSRLYLLRDGQIYLMTEDHSAVMEMVQLGIITLEQARHHEDKNVILRALGTNPEVEVSIWENPLAVRDGDQFLLCSDGLYDLVEDQEIKALVLAVNDTYSACESLIELAKERGGHDNITVAIIGVKPAGYTESRSLRETRELEVVL